MLRINSCSDRTLRIAATVVVFAMFGAFAVYAIGKLSDSHQLLLGQNSTAGVAKVGTAGEGKEVCIVNQFVPAGTELIRVSTSDKRSLDSVIRVVPHEGDREASLRGPPKRVVDARGNIRLPLETRLEHAGRRSFCIEASGKPVELLGVAEFDRDPSTKLIVNGRSVNREIALGFFSTSGTVGGELGAVLKRAAMFKPGLVTPATIAIVLALVLMLLLTTLAIMVTGRGSNFSARRWILLIALVTIVNGTAWAVITPQFQPPDEQEHFAYVDTLMNRGVPHETEPPGAYTPALQNTLSVTWRGIVLNRDVKPPWNTDVERAWQAGQRKLRSKDDEASSVTSAAGYSPLYYAIAGVPLELGGSSYTNSLWLIRLLSVLMTAGAAIFAFLAARELRAEPWWFAPATGLIVGSLPMLLHIGAAVHPDAMLNMLAAALVWSVAIVFRRGLSLRRALTVTGIFGLMFVVKPVAAGLAPALLVAAIIALFKDQRGPRRALLDLSLAALLALGLITLNYLLFKSGSAAVSATTGGGRYINSIRAMASYSWQWFLPPLPGQFIWITASPLSAPWITVIMTGFVANFNHLDTFFPLRFYQLLTIALVATGGALAVKLVRIRSTASEWLPFTAFALAAVSGLTAFLLVSAYRLMISTGGWLIQGRYFLPLAALFAIFLAASALAVGRRAGLVVAVALICGFGLLNLASLGLSLSRFYV